MIRVPTIQTVYLDVMLNRTLDSSIFHHGNWVIRSSKEFSDSKTGGGGKNDEFSVSLYIRIMSLSSYRR